MKIPFKTMPPNRKRENDSSITSAAEKTRLHHCSGLFFPGTQLDSISQSPFKKVGPWNSSSPEKCERKWGRTTMGLGAVKSLVCPLHVLSPHPLEKVRGLQEKAKGRHWRQSVLGGPARWQETALLSHLTPSHTHTLYFRLESSKQTSIMSSH